MSQLGLKRYTLFFISLLVTGLVMVFLFLRPDTALGLEVEVDTPANSINGLSGFKLQEPVEIIARIKLEGGFEDLALVTLAIEQIIGDPGFLPVTGGDIIVLPVLVTADDITDQLPTSGGVPQGTLLVEVTHTEVILVRFNNGYGYQGTGDTGGIIQYKLTYTPPGIVGDYLATLTVTPRGASDVSFGTQFSVLGALSVEALATIYPRSDGEALAGDMVVLQLDSLSARAKDIVSAIVFGDLTSETLSMIKASNFHPSLRGKWDVNPTADFLLPLKVERDTDPGRYNPTLRVQGRAGQTFTTSTTSPATSPEVEVADTRKSFNVYLMPKFTFVTPVLQCPLADDPILCTGDQEFDVVAFLEQPVSADKVSPAFVANLISIGEIATPSDLKAKNLVEKVFSYDPFLAPADFRGYTPSALFPDDLLRLTVGNGYIVKTRRLDSLEPFKTADDPRNPQFPDRAIPVSIKLTFKGKFIALIDQVPPETDVKAGVNLVGAHSETDTTVGEYLIPVTVGGRTWVQLIAFRNLVDVALDDAGKVKVRTVGSPPEVFPVVVFKRRFETLHAPAGEPDAGLDPKPSGDPVPVGAGLWLFMNADGRLLAVHPSFEE